MQKIIGPTSPWVLKPLPKKWLDIKKDQGQTKIIQQLEQLYGSGN
jgi:hypothetical protein